MNPGGGGGEGEGGRGRGGEGGGKGGGGGEGATSPRTCYQQGACATRGLAGGGWGYAVGAYHRTLSLWILLLHHISVQSSSHSVSPLLPAMPAHCRRRQPYSWQLSMQIM